MTENNAGPDQTTASLFPLPDPITEPVRCEVTPSPKKRGLKGEAIPGQLSLWGFVSHSRGGHLRDQREAQELSGHNESDMEVNSDDAPVQ